MTRHMQVKLKLQSFLLLLFFYTVSGVCHAERELIHSVDFTTQPEGDAHPWLEKRGYLMELDAQDINVVFKNKQLNIEAEGAQSAIFGLKLKPENYLADISFIEIEWGVVKQPTGADWEAGNNRVPIAFIFFFGTEEVSSGLPFGINSAPYFLSPFIGLKEQKDKVYLGKLYQKGGRYICLATTPGSEELIKSTIKTDPLFLKLFKKNEIPPITAIAFQINTKDTQGGAHAFIRKLRFYSDK